jgi:RHS repeat-associated protein
LRYHPWGGTRYTSGTTPTARRFTGQIEDAAIGLYFYNARYYDPYLNRFISPDTIIPDPANPQSLNRYSYVLNNPLKYTDPTGHEYDERLPGGGGGGLGGGLWSSDWEYKAYIKSEFGSWEEYYARLFESIGGYGYTSQSSPPEGLSEEGQFQELVGQYEEYEGDLIYRSGSNKPATYTPRVSDVQEALAEGDLPGVSTFNSIENRVVPF